MSVTEILSHLKERKGLKSKREAVLEEDHTASCIITEMFLLILNNHYLISVHIEQGDFPNVFFCIELTEWYMLRLLQCQFFPLVTPSDSRRMTFS